MTLRKRRRLQTWRRSRRGPRMDSLHIIHTPASMNEISSAVSSLGVPREKPMFNVDEEKAWLAWTAPISLRLVAAIGQEPSFETMA